MATILDSDLVLIGRGGNSFRTPAQDLKTFVATGDGVTYRGTANFTVDPVIDPDPPVVGDLYFNTTAGTLNANWAAGGATVAEGDRILWNGSAWELIQGTSDIGVETVAVTAPIVNNGTASTPDIGISDATTAAKGAVQLADDAYEANGLINTTNTATDVLTGTHFDVLAGRITTAAGGGIQDVNGSNGVTASVTTGTATVTGIDAGVGVVGVVALDNTVADVANTAATPKAINDYSVPLNLGSLPELT